MGKAERTRIAGLIDHSLLRPDASLQDIKRLCEEAARYGFCTVCVNPVYVEAAARLLWGTGVGVCAVVGFPLGADLTEAKVYEARAASLLGAGEIDMVMDIGAAKSGRWGRVSRDISDVVMATPGLVHKVIIEACYLTDEEKVRASKEAVSAGAAFVKTSTGFGPGGATAGDVRLIRGTVGESAGVKAAGGIRGLAEVKEMLGAGASRIGISCGPAIVEEIPL